MKKLINGITYNSESGKLLKESTFIDNSGGRKLYVGTRGRAKGKYFIVTWRNPYHTEIAIKECDEEDIDTYIWD